MNSKPMENLTRRTFLKMAGSGACAAAMGLNSAASVSAEQPQRPNIVFIMADDLGYHHLGCYGQTKIKTPHIDQLAREGMRFTQCYAGAPVCAPSRSVLMTGYHGGHTSVRGNSGGLSLLPEDVTIGEILQKAGYRTGIFGKWGLGDAGTDGIPAKQGFDEFFGYLHQVHAHFYYPYYLWKNEQKYLLPGNEKEGRRQYSQDEIAQQALQFIRDNKDHPFFLYVPFTAPHTELLVPQDSFQKYDGAFPEPSPYIDSRRHYADQPKPRTAFAAMVDRMDREVGRIMSLLQELNLDENTIVFFTSDNGGQGSGGPDLEFFQGNRPLRGAKGQLYEGGIRVPGVARWPNRIEAGAVSDHVWAFDDVLPTLAELAGAETPQGVDGASFAPTLLGETRKQKQRSFFYWEMGANKRAVRMGDWKGIMTDEKKPLELYNLKSDIGETRNIADQHPGVVQQIKTYMMETRTPPRKYRKEPPAWGYPRDETGYIR